MNSSTNSNNNRFLKFALVGISGTIVDFGFFNIFSVIVGFPVVLSSVLSFSIAVFNNFYWNRIWTYPESMHSKLSDQLTKFGLISVAGLIIRTPLLAFIEKPVTKIFKRVFPLNFPINAEIIGQNLALGIVIIIVLFWNYFVNKYWTYKNLDFSQEGRKENGS